MTQRLIGGQICRGCGGTNMFSAMDLGETPLANELLAEKGEAEVFPLHLKVCVDCYLGQVADTVHPERLFLDYRYKSGPSQTFSQHLDCYVSDVIEELGFKREDWVLEIASNDGSLQNKFRAHGIECIGVEPSINVARYATNDGNVVINDFFSTQLARKILNRFGFPRLVVANNVLAHVPDLNDFFKGISLLTSNNTLVTIENPSLLNVLAENQFDTIYHEHYSYLSESFMRYLSLKHGLTLLGVKKLTIHGGSNRYFLKSNSSNLAVSNLQSDLERENKLGLNKIESWGFACKRMQRTISDFEDFLNSQKAEGKIIVGYGAAAKTTTLLSLLQTTSSQIDFIVDKSNEKIGRFLPIANIPIRPISHLLETQIDHIIVFPWNIIDEIAIEIKSLLKREVNIWRVIPKLERVL